MSYLTYSDRRTSNVEWIGEIPHHWHVSYVRRFYDVDLGKMVNQAAQNGSGTVKPYLRAANIHWGRIDIDDVNEMEFTPDQLQRYRLAKGDLLVTEGGVTVGRSAIWGGQIDECYYQNSLNRVRPKNSRQSVEFLYYWMYFTKSNGYVDLITDNATFSHLTNEKLLAFPILEIPFEEQTAIANFLDHETAKIDTLIAKQQRLIELLQEKRQALISHAVTKGLNPDAPMKDSGIEWLGEIPAHWKTTRLKYLSPSVTVGIVVTPAKYYEDEGVACLRSLNIKEGYISDDNLVYISKESNTLLAKSILKNGDLVAVRSGQPGTTAIVSEKYHGCNCIDLIIVRQSEHFSSTFMCYYLNSDAAKIQYSSGSEGAIQQHFNVETAKNLALPNLSIAEQNEIVDYLDIKTAQMDQLTQKLQSTLDLLQERRASLISAAVTGKIDVRGHV